MNNYSPYEFVDSFFFDNLKQNLLGKFLINLCQEMEFDKVKDIEFFIDIKERKFFRRWKIKIPFSDLKLIFTIRRKFHGNLLLINLFYFKFQVQTSSDFFMEGAFYIFPFYH